MKMRDRWNDAMRQYAGVEIPDAPLTRERFRVDVEQNHNTAGLGTTGFLKWRYTVIDTLTGRAQKTDYGMTRSQCEAQGTRIVTKILAGKRAVK